MAALLFLWFVLISIGPSLPSITKLFFSAHWKSNSLSRKKEHKFLICRKSHLQNMLAGWNQTAKDFGTSISKI